MRALDLKLARDLWRIRGQVIAISLVIGSGVAVLVQSLSTLEAIDETSQVYYERYRFAEIFASAIRVPERVADRVAEIPGVEAVDTRISRFATLDIDGFQEPVIGQLLSVPESGQPTLNQLVVRSGKWVSSGRHDEVIVNERFAEEHGLEPGSKIRAVVNGHRRELEVVGTALSPEFIYALAPGAMLPDNKRFGILWMGREALEAAFDLDGAFNDLTVTLLRETPEAPVMTEIDSLLEPYGGIDSISRADQVSAWFVANELAQMRTMSRILPTIFLAVAAFLTNMVLARLIATERSEIGLLKAFGYSSLHVGWHYVKMVIVIALVGVVLGSLMGVALGRYNTENYAQFFRFPLLIYRPGGFSFFVGALVSVVTAILGAVGSVKRAMDLPPATAMQPPAPPAFQRGVLDSFGVAQWFDQPTRIVVRQIARAPVRSALTVVGVAMSIALLIMALQWDDAIDRFVDILFFDAQRQSATVGLAETQSSRVLYEFEHLPGVMAVEPQRAVAADLRVGVKSHRGGIVGLPVGASLQPIYDEQGEREIPVPVDGIVLGSYLANKLEVGVGDSLWVEVLQGRRPSGRVTVSDIFNTSLGMPAYMNIEALNRWMRESQRVSAIHLLVDPHREPELFRELKQIPTVSAISFRRGAIESFYETLGQHIYIYVTVFAFFACALGFGVAYNSSRITLSERGRELATLRVLGFRRTEISYILLAEVGMLILISLPVGCVAGQLLSALMSAAFDTELFRVSLTIDASTYGFAMLLALIATGVSSILVRRRLDRLDLIEVLKTRE